MFLPKLLSILTICLSTAFAQTTTSFSSPTTIQNNESTPSTTPIDFITTKYMTIAGVTNDHVTIPAKTINIAIPTCIQTVTPDKNGYFPPGTCNSLYEYYPSFVAAIVFSVLFGILTIAHITQAAIYKKKFCWVLIMGTIWEFLSFTTRTLSTKNQQSTTLKLLSDLFVLLAPLWINAFAYMLLARMIHFYLPSHRILHIPASIFAIIFVSLDFVSFVVQLVGGSYAGPTAPMEMQMKGVHIYMGGIGLQQFFIFVFVGVLVKFQLEMGRVERVGEGKEGWKRLCWTLYASLGFISIRIFFRLIEFSAGKTSNNPLPFHEGYFYGLEAVPMVLAILCFNATHPGMYLTGQDSELPGLKETFWKKRGWRKSDEDSTQKLVGEYAMLERKESGGREPPKYNV